MKSLNVIALQSWLKNNLGNEDALSVQKISGGQSNPTWFVNWGAQRLVLRKKPEGQLIRGAHAIDREYRIQSAIYGSPVPVNEVLLYEENEAVLGSAFYIMKRLEGRVFEDCSLHAAEKHDRKEMYLDVARTLAKLHNLDPLKLGLSNFGRHTEYYYRQFQRWSSQYGQSNGPKIRQLDAVIRWISENIPSEDGLLSLAHGDFRIGNMIFHPTEPKVIGVLDWELSTLGHPLADLAFCIIPWFSSKTEYGGLLDTDWKVSGIPEHEIFIDEYIAHSNHKSRLTTFHLVFAFFRFSVIFRGIEDRAREGNAASDEAHELGVLASRFAARALNLIETDPFKRILGEGDEKPYILSA